MWEVKEERTCRFSIALDASTSGGESTLAGFPSLSSSLGLALRGRGWEEGSPGQHRSCPPASSGSGSGTTAGIDNHVGDVGLDDVAVPVIVEQREGATLCGHAAGVHSCVRVVGFDEVEDGRVEGGSETRDASHV